MIINNCKALIDEKRHNFQRHFTSFKQGSYAFIGSEAYKTGPSSYNPYGQKFDKKGHKLTMILDLRNNKKSLS